MQMSQFYTHKYMMYLFYTLILYLLYTIFYINSILNNVLSAFNSILILYSNTVLILYSNNVLILYNTACSNTELKYMHMCTSTHFLKLCMSGLISEMFWNTSYSTKSNVLTRKLHISFVFMISILSFIFHITNTSELEIQNGSYFSWFPNIKPLFHIASY